MRPENSIFEAALPQPYVILGLKLKPFSLGHYMILHRHGNAFVSHERAVATREDLIFACLVCSMTFDEFAEWQERLPAKWTTKAAELIRFCVGRSSRAELSAAFSGNLCLLDVTRWGRKYGWFNLEDKVKLFREYRDANCSEPKYWVEKEDSRERGGHWLSDVFQTLTGHCGFTRDQALNMSMREALLHFFQYAQSQGVVTLMTDEQIAEGELNVSA